MVLDLSGGNPPAETAIGEMRPLTVSAMTPADFRDARAKAWRKCWAGVTPGKNERKLPEAAPPADLGVGAAVLAALQRIAAWGNCEGMNAESVVFALESLLQRCGLPQRPPCCVCRGTGQAKDEVGRARACPEGCR